MFSSLSGGVGVQEIARCIVCKKPFEVRAMVPYGNGDRYCLRCHSLKKVDREQKIKQDEAKAFIASMENAGFEKTALFEISYFPDHDAYQTIIAGPKLIDFQEMVALGAKVKGINIKFKIKEEGLKK